MGKLTLPSKFRAPELVGILAADAVGTGELTGRSAAPVTDLVNTTSSAADELSAALPCGWTDLARRAFISLYVASFPRGVLAFD